MKNTDLLAHLKGRRAETLCSLVAEELERMIIRGELQAGDRINESALAQMRSISRGPIREACRSLAKSFIFSAAVACSFEGIQWLCRTRNMCALSRHCVSTAANYQNAP